MNTPDLFHAEVCAMADDHRRECVRCSALSAIVILLIGNLLDPATWTFWTFGGIAITIPLLGWLQQWVLRYRIKHDLYGKNPEEMRSLLIWRKHRNNNH